MGQKKWKIKRKDVKKLLDTYEHMKHPKVHMMEKVIQVIQESREGKPPSYTKDELFKESKYDQLTGEERKEVAKVLLLSPRGRFLVARALDMVIYVMSLEEYPEYSDIDDMRLLTDLFLMRLKGSGEIIIGAD